MDIESVVRSIQKSNTRTAQIQAQSIESLERKMGALVNTITQQQQAAAQRERQNEQTQSRILKSLSGLQKQGKDKETKDDKRRDKADFEFKKKQDDDQNLEGIEEHLEEIKDILTNLKGNNKDSGGLSLPKWMKDPKNWAKALVPAVGAAVTAYSTHKVVKEAKQSADRKLNEAEKKKGAPLTKEEETKVLQDDMTSPGKILGGNVPGVAQDAIVQQTVNKNLEEQQKNLDAGIKPSAEVISKLQESGGKGIFGTTHKMPFEDNNETLKNLSVATRNILLMQEQIKEMETAVAKSRMPNGDILFVKDKDRIRHEIKLKKANLERWKKKQEEAAKEYDKAANETFELEKGLNKDRVKPTEPKPAPPPEPEKHMAGGSHGPMVVPGIGTGDKVRANLEHGDFVLNQRAVKHYFPRFQQGGNALLEPGEMVFPQPSKEERKKLSGMNKSVARHMPAPQKLQEGGEKKSDSGGFVIPLERGRIGTAPYQVFGAPRDGGARSHAGVDLVEKAPWGSDPKIQVLSAKAGTVLSERYSNDSYTGGMIVRQNDGYDARYVHMSNSVQPGQEVKAGTPLGRLLSLGSGGSNSHLHFELYREGSSSPLDPTPYLQSAGEGKPGASVSGGKQKAPDGEKGSQSGGRDENKSSVAGFMSGISSAMEALKDPSKIGESIMNMMSSGNLLGALAASTGGAALASIVPALGPLLNAGATLVGQKAIDSGSNNGGSSNAQISGDMETKGVGIAKRIMADFDVGKNAAAGVVGNLMLESGLKPDNVEDGKGFEDGPINNVPVGTQRVGYGYGQWTNDRLEKCRNFLSSRDAADTPATDEDNYAYLKHELGGDEPLKNHWKTGTSIPNDTPENAATWFMMNWERPGVPHQDRRQQYARTIAEKLQSGSDEKTEKPKENAPDKPKTTIAGEAPTPKPATMQSGGQFNALLEPGEMVFKHPSPKDTKVLKEMNKVSRFQFKESDTGGNTGSNNGTYSSSENVQGMNEIQSRMKQAQNINTQDMMKQASMGQQIFNIQNGTPTQNTQPNVGGASQGQSMNLPNEPTSHIASTLMMQQYTLSQRIG